MTRAQLLRLGVTPAEIEHRLGVGMLLREHRGVYRVGHRAPSVEARYLAATWACGQDALLGGRPAGHLFGVVRGTAPRPEVITATERRVPGITTRRARGPVFPDATFFRGIPVMTLPWVVVDLAAVLQDGDLARACHEAGVRYGLTPGQVEAVLARRPNAAGAAAVRAVLSGDVPVTLSVLERGFLDRLREVDLPVPRTNRPAGGRRVDCRWADDHLTVELDSYRYHGSRHAWEQDRLREREAHARGDQFRRYTYRDVFEDSRPMLRELRQLLRPTVADVRPAG